MSSGKKRASPKSGKSTWLRRRILSILAHFCFHHTSSGRESEDFFDVAIEGRGLVQHVPMSAIKVVSPTDYKTKLSRKDLPPGKPVIIDLKNGKWAPGFIHDSRQSNHSFGQENHNLLSHFPNTPYTPRIGDSGSQLSFSGIGRTPDSSGRLSSVMEAFDYEVKRIARERERLKEAWYHRKEEEARLGYEREQLRVAMEQTRALRIAEEATLQKERARLEAVLRMSAQVIMCARG
jgi:hypothetical protein